MPYVVIGVLSGFQPAFSTVVQRTWILLWLVCGQGTFVFIVIVMEVCVVLRLFGEESGWLVVCISLFSSILSCGALASTIGGLVVVAGMIQQDGICIRV